MTSRTTFEFFYESDRVNLYVCDQIKILILDSINLQIETSSRQQKLSKEMNVFYNLSLFFKQCLLCSIRLALTHDYPALMPSFKVCFQNHQNLKLDCVFSLKYILK